MGNTAGAGRGRLRPARGHRPASRPAGRAADSAPGPITRSPAPARLEGGGSVYTAGTGGDTAGGCAPPDSAPCRTGGTDGDLEAALPPPAVPQTCCSCQTQGPGAQSLPRPPPQQQQRRQSGPSGGMAGLLLPQASHPPAAWTGPSPSSRPLAPPHQASPSPSRRPARPAPLSPVRVNTHTHPGLRFLPAHAAAALPAAGAAAGARGGGGARPRRAHGHPGTGPRRCGPLPPFTS